MKKIYIAILGIFFMTCSYAQTKVDRTKPPAGGPAPVLSIGEPVTYHLANGITVLVVENHKLPKVSATYMIDYGPVTEGNKAGVLSVMGNMLEEGTTNMDKAAFDEAVDQMGANVNLSERGGNASALTRYFDKSFMLMADALLHPAFPASSFDKIKSQMLTGLKSNEKSAKAISARVVNALSFGVTHPTGEFETEETINNITLDDVRKFYTQYISPSRGFLTFVGDIKPEHAKELAEKAFGNWKGTSISLINPADVKNPGKTEIDLVDVPNAVQSEITVTNVVRIPMSSPDYFPVLLANNILGGNADARLFMNLREKHGYTYGAYSGIGSGRFQATFNASASVRNEKVDSAVIEILHEINNIRTSKVSAEELKNAKALYAGNFALGLEDPARTAGFASNIILNNLPKDFYKTYLQKINAVTAEDVERVAQKYFNHDNTRIIVVGKAATVKPGLSKLGYAVNMYDRFAKPVQETVTTTMPSTGVTAKDIIAKYIIAIGGAEELKKINSVSMTGSMSLQGMNLAVTEKKMAPNMSMMEMNMNGQALMRKIFNGTTGYQSQMGNKKELEGDDLAESKNTKGLFEQLFYNDGGYKLEMGGTEKVNSKDAYKINVTTPLGTKYTEYYDISTGYLVKIEKTIKAQEQELQQTIEHSNYKKVGNVMFPFTNTISVQSANGGQDFTIEVTDIKINEGVKAEDFK
ncbi:MAG: insulinase family protein [Chitinophagaceae bacterium]|nr:insulinase family protein [Chitinophagaceae bacterium]